MKSIRSLLPILAVVAVIHAGCVTMVSRPADVLVESEEKAVAMLGDDINTLYLQLLNKKVGVFYFTTMDWSATAAGKRISDSLDNYLVKKGKLSMVSRTELERIFRNEVAEQAGMYDMEGLQERGGALPIDAVIYGTVDNAGDAMEINVRVVDVKTGKRLLQSGVRMPSSGEITAKANPDMLLLNRKSPDKIIAMNKTYYMLSWMKARQPLVFLLVALKDSEVKSLVGGSTVLGAKLKVRMERYKRERPEIMQQIDALKDGLALINRHEPHRFSDINRWKKELLDNKNR
jgi:hypothetical protein